MASLIVNGITVDTAAPKVALAALSLANADASSSDYVLVQTKHPLVAAQRDELSKSGAQILEAVPGGGLICHFPDTNLAKLRALDFVQWADVYPHVVKISPALLQIAPKTGGVDAAVAVLARPAALDAARVTIDVVLHRNVDVQQAVKRVAGAAHLKESELTVSAGKIRMTVKRRRLAEIASLDEVRNLEEVVAPQLSNNIARDILRVPAAGTSTAFTGKGEIVAVADTGFDKGSTTDVHPAFKGRVKKLYAVGRASRKDDPDGHGTHVAGSVLGDGVSTADGPIRGTAPGAKLVLQSVLGDDDQSLNIPSDLGDLFSPPYKNDKARVHTNSWGSPSPRLFGVYDPQARELDDFVYRHRDMLICFAAGNQGKDGDSNGQVDLGSVSPPGTAKNCLTVGACENNRPNQLANYGQGFPGDFPAEPIKSDLIANNPEGMVAFSGRGPTNDHRIKPEVVAPGSYILSTRSRVTESQGWGLTADKLYMFDGGTSMATPLVAGCVAVVREFLRKQHSQSSPSAALLKALIINGAHALAGQYVPSEAGPVPSNSQGFGRVDVQAVVGPYAANESIQFFDEKRKLDTNEREDRTIAVTAGARKLKVTLVWTDPPGEGLQSDLDLVVSAGGVERHGNIAAGSAEFDRTNNVEQVTWENVPVGQVKVSVVGYSIAIEPQDYALVIRIS